MLGIRCSIFDVSEGLWKWQSALNGESPCYLWSNARRSHHSPAFPRTDFHHRRKPARRNQTLRPRPSRNVTFAGAGICEVFAMIFCRGRFIRFPFETILKIRLYHNFFTKLLPASDTSLLRLRQISLYEMLNFYRRMRSTRKLD